LLLKAQGSITTDATVDYTVKVDVTGLSPDTYYYYEFKALDNFSPRGRTKTAPLEVTNVDSLRFAVVSCANLEAGVFNAYEVIAKRNDVEAILMLGDYIYEHEEGGYASNSNVDRIFDPTHEILTLDDYRLRYSVYHMDQALQKLHQNFPWICV
jgi:phosphodiesterase/alkaline phosphatase D-like protein